MKDQNLNIKNHCDCMKKNCKCHSHKTGRCERMSQVNRDIKKKRFAETGFEGVKSA